MAWSQGTNGPVSGELILVEVSKAEFGHNKEYEADVDKFIQKYKGQLHGRSCCSQNRSRMLLKPEENAQFRRYTDADLAKMAEAPEPSAKPAFDPKNLVIPEDPDEARELFSALPFALIMKLYNQREAIEGKLNAFLVSENVVAVLGDDRRAHDAMFSEAAGHTTKGPACATYFVLTAEHYNRLTRLAGEESASTGASQPASRSAGHPGGRPQHRRRDSRNHEEGRDRHARRPFRFLAHGNRRH